MACATRAMRAMSGRVRAQAGGRVQTCVCGIRRRSCLDHREHSSGAERPKCSDVTWRSGWFGRVHGFFHDARGP